MRSSWILAASMLLSVNCLAQGSNLELDALLMESNQLLQQGQANEALALLEREQNRFSSRPEYLNNLAVALLGSSQPDRALGLLRNYVDSDPVLGVLFHNLLELELRANREPTDQLNPVLFVQSVDSFLEAGLEQIDRQVAEAPAQESAQPAVTDRQPLDPGSHENALRDALMVITNSWAQAWSNKNLERYLAFYTADYRPANGQTHQEWIANRTSALSKPGEISIELTNMDVEREGEQAIVRFDQAYSSSNYSDKVRKTLVYSFTDSGWRISRETSVFID